MAKMHEDGLLKAKKGSLINTLCPEKGALLFLALTSPNRLVNRLSKKFFHRQT